jgi:predicted GNAT family acetyltransferase
LRRGASRGLVRAQMLTIRERDAALTYLARQSRHNLLLTEMVSAVGQPASASELPPQVVVARRGGQIVGVATLRPSIVVDFDMEQAALDACLPLLKSIETGLIKSVCRVVTPLWDGLRAQGRRALIDRKETAYALSGRRRSESSTRDERMRQAVDGDLDALVHAARASLREEDRPDPFDGDPTGFRRWVRGRLHRARVVEDDGQVVFVGYADVRRPEGWLIQGVYTWPGRRCQGVGRAGMTGLVQEAVAAGTDHIQLAVVEGNLPAIRLYEGLGFEPFSELRTILFM